MRSKVNFGHPKWPTAAILSKMSCNQKWISDMQNIKKQKHSVKWPEMWSKVNLGHPKWPTAVILSKISKQIKVAYRSEMARNAIKSEFRSSKMGAGGHFVKKKYKKVSYWSEMARNAIEISFRHPKWPPAAILFKNSQNKNYGIDLKWQEVIFGHPKWLPAAI